jgi:hypothetical protein
MRVTTVLDPPRHSPARAHVKVYCGSASLDPIYEVGPVSLHESGSPWDENDFWKVADVSWDGFHCQVTPLGAIVTTSQAQAAR